MKALIIDDDAVDRKLLKRALNSKTGVIPVCTEADSVSEGLRALKTGPFDVILLDYRMPGANGIEFVLEMRARPDLGDAAIIIVSSADEPEIALECIEAGAQDFLLKEEITITKLEKCIVHARKRFEIEREMHASYQAVKRMAEKDALTGLSNRFHFEEILKVMTASASRTRNSLALLALDLDNFKEVNDKLGHAVGDLVLKEAVRRIASCLRENEGFARLGGDEFAIIIGNVEGPRVVTSIANRILARFEEPLSIEGTNIFCGLSLGAALYPEDASDPQELLKCADIAMYRAKHGVTNKLCFYEDRYQAEFRRRALIHDEMADILRSSSFRLFYQPIIEASSSAVVGVEALIRWPERETSFTPGEFIPIAEDTRLIEPLGYWIVTTAVEQLATWHAEGLHRISMSLNISPLQLTHDGLNRHLLAEVRRFKVEPSDITLEITETALFKDDDKIQTQLTGLKEAGFRIALDDFGMGFSSIAHLMRHPVDIVKLDRSLQVDTDARERPRKMLEGLTLMLQKLDFEIVAEGIESESQRQLCVDLGIQRLQGYLFGRPGPATQLSGQLLR